MAFKHAFTVISTNFDLEPALEEYVKSYPEGELQNYRIVFKTEGEHQPESRSYIIVYEYHRSSWHKSTSLQDFIKSYCTVHNFVAVTNPIGHVLPDISATFRPGQPTGVKIFGRYEKPSSEGGQG